MILERIHSPRDLKALTQEEMTTLASELRERIIETVKETGGHLGPNLGVVELTLALHSAFDSPWDRILFDVGHQCYTHKLLTGRSKEFASLRQYQGISGFPKREESEHDVFDVGHSSTSISAASGIALARDLRGERYNVVAVIGDGALTGGLAFEALNHVGQLKTHVIVVLNDNEMSIAPNVGAVSEYLNRLRLDPTLSRAREELEAFIRKIPAVGGSFSRVADALKDAVKSLLPGQLFEEFGFSYFGPFDGHNISALKRAFRDGMNKKGPVLIHVKTQKGKGYAPAERNPAKFHGVGPLEEHLVPVENQLSYSAAFGAKLVELARGEPRIVAITAAMCDGTGLKEFSKCYPDRLFDVGIAEQHALTLAAGMACGGLRPVVAVYSTFLQRAYDQVLHDICLQNLPVVIAIDRAGVVGDDGPTHHGVFDISFLRSMPNLTLLAPKDGRELQAMLDWALKEKGPVAIRYPRGNTTVGPVALLQQRPKCEIVRSGEDCTIFAVGPMVAQAQKAASLLSSLLECMVVNVRCLKPLDEDTLHLARSAKFVVTLEDHVLAGGFGSALLEELAFTPRPQVLRLGYPDAFIPQGSIEELHGIYGLTGEKIAERIASEYALQSRCSVRGT